jgi:hypothetical protein
MNTMMPYGCSCCILLNMRCHAVQLQRSVMWQLPSWVRPLSQTLCRTSPLHPSTLLYFSFPVVFHTYHWITTGMLPCSSDAAHTQHCTRTVSQDYQLHHSLSYCWCTRDFGQLGNTVISQCTWRTRLFSEHCHETVPIARGIRTALAKCWEGAARGWPWEPE